MPSGRVLGVSEHWVMFSFLGCVVGMVNGYLCCSLYMVKDVTTLIVKESSGFSY